MLLVLGLLVSSFGFADLASPLRIFDPGTRLWVAVYQVA